MARRCAHAALLSWSNWAAVVVVGTPEDHVDREVAQLLGEHLDAPRPGVAVVAARLDVAAMSNSPSPGSSRWLTISSIGSSMSSKRPSLSSTHDRYSSGMRRSSSGAIPSLRHVPGVDREAAVRGACAADDLEHGVELLTFDVERHELVDDLRVGVLRRVGAQLAEALRELRELGRRAGDVADLDVVRAELGGRLEEQPRGLVGGLAALVVRVEEPVHQELELEVAQAVVVERLLHLGRLCVSSTCSRSACQMPMPLKPTLRASAQRSAQSKRLHSRPKCTSTGPEIVQYSPTSSTSVGHAHPLTSAGTRRARPRRTGRARRSRGSRSARGARRSASPSRRPPRPRRT